MVTFCSRLIHQSDSLARVLGLLCKSATKFEFNYLPCFVFAIKCICFFLWPDSALSLQVSIHIVDAYNACTFFFVVLVHQQDEATKLNYIMHLLES